MAELPILKEMIDSENPDLVVAFHEDLESRNGMKDMINREKKQ